MQIGHREFDFSRRVYVMGILNVTPDSFSDGGLYRDPDRALDRALEMESEGADLIDIGGESTRPGSDPVSEKDEWKRLEPILKKIIPKLKIPVSLDTRKAAVAERGIAEGGTMINDVSALRDPLMPEVIRKGEVPVILMHMRGEPKTMQREVSYRDLISEITQFLSERISSAVERGIPRDKILVDPGIGFGKRYEDNLEILRRLPDFKKLECPLVFGSSRKSFIHKMFGDNPQDILLGSVGTALIAAERGASLLRVHDVRETRRLIQLANRTLFG